MSELPLNPLAEFVWRTRYQGVDAKATRESSPAGTFRRVSRALSAAEPDAAGWQSRFEGILAGYHFLPGGRILAAAGQAAARTMLNCFVMGTVEDGPERLFGALAEGARTLQQGGGIGWDFSALRPRGDLSGEFAALGPVACLELWDAACRAVTTGLARGGAMMASLSTSHPDIDAFVRAKARPGALPRFNLSVQVPDAFLQAVEDDARWELSLPLAGATASRAGSAAPALRARALERLICSSMLEWSEPGVLFVDTINRENNLWWRERLATTNPCGEVPLPPYGACDLGSVNLAELVIEPFGSSARLDFETLERTARVAVRLLDNVLDASAYPLPQQRREALQTRRIGLGVTGLADALAMLGLRYDSEAGRALAISAVERLKISAYEASIELAVEKGAFPAFDRERYLAGAFVTRLPARIRDRIARSGIRNSHLLAIAPTGSISLLAGNVSPGIEPISALRQSRRVTDPQGGFREFEVEDRAWSLFRASGRRIPPPAFMESGAISPSAQLDMQSALQRHVDGAISKTILLPDTFTSTDLSALLRDAHQGGLKGFAVHRPGSARGSVIASGCAGRLECDPG
jgi:ribonucleoside-diphosphate reductase alpha chain